MSETNNTSALVLTQVGFPDRKQSEATATEPTIGRQSNYFEGFGDALPRILDPDDGLMKRFQKTLSDHLNRVLGRLDEEVLDLEASIRKSDGELEGESTRLYYVQQEVTQQRANIKQYQDALNELTVLQQKEMERLEAAKQQHKESRGKLLERKKRQEELAQELEKATSLQSRFSQWEQELNDYISVSKRISKRDAVSRKQLIEQKQRKDYILYRLSQELMRVETEIADLDEQLQIKEREKADANRMLIEANTDLESLQREQKQLRDAWNTVIGQISRKDAVYDQLNSEREELRRQVDGKSYEIERLKKDTEKEMELNEYLTSLSTRIESNLKVVSKMSEVDSNKIANLESQLTQLSKMGEQIQTDYDAICLKYRDCQSKEDQVLKEFDSVASRKARVEQAIFDKLESKLVQDKTARYIGELLASSKEAALEQEFLLTKTENNYGNALLQLERLTNEVARRKSELDELLQKNAEKSRQIDETTRQITKHEMTTERKQAKLIQTNRTIEEILPNLGGKEMSPMDLKIVGLQKSIHELQQTILDRRGFWMRQQGYVVSLSQQRNTQLRELNLLNKEIMIMEQKNAKIEYALEKLGKEEADANRTLHLLEQRVQRINSDLVLRKDIKEELEDKNSIARSECMAAFQEREMHLVKMQRDLEDLQALKASLKEELEAVTQESLAWERKVQVTQEIMKKIKEENNSGEMMLMRSEIHKMEMRQSQLKRVQEKLIHDMEFCVARRDIMVDKALGKSKRNPRERHNRTVVMKKRLADHKAKVKNQWKILKQVEESIADSQALIKEMRTKISEAQACRRDCETKIPEINIAIAELETLKLVNVQAIVWKQRKARLLREIKAGRYKMLVKSEAVIEEDLQNEITCRSNLKQIMEKTSQDFPKLKLQITKILLALHTEETLVEVSR